MGIPKILVKDYMKPAELTFSPQVPVQQVVEELIRHGLTGGPVLDEHQKLIGYITEQDCLKEILDGSFYCENHKVVADIMRKNPLYITPNDDIAKVAEMIVDKKPKQYPVVEEDKVVGILTRTDVLKALSRLRKESCPT